MEILYWVFHLLFLPFLFVFCSNWVSLWVVWAEAAEWVQIIFLFLGFSLMVWFLEWSNTKIAMTAEVVPCEENYVWFSIAFGLVKQSFPSNGKKA